METNQTTESSYIPTESEWFTIIDTCADYIFWVVKAYQTTDFCTGYYYSDYYDAPIPQLYELSTETFISNTITEIDECDWYEFVVPMTGTYVFETYGDMDTYGELFSGVAYNKTVTNYLNDGEDDDSGSDRNFRIEYEFTTQQIVYLRVRGFSWFHIGNYSLSVTCINHSHEFIYKPINSKYHILECHCGETTGSKLLHIIDSSASYGTPGFKPCMHCGLLININTGGIIPSLGINNNNYIVSLDEKKKI